MEVAVLILPCSHLMLKLALAGPHNVTNLESPEDPAILYQIEHHLLKGNIVAAHSLALQHRLWPHALLLSQYVGFSAFQDTVSKYAMNFAEVSLSFRYCG